MTPTKLYAVVDKDGKHASKALSSEFRAWLDCLSISTNFASDSYINEQISMAKKHGYRCIELHTYDPATHGVYEKATQVVVDRELYEQHRKWTDNVAKGWDKFNYPHIEQFLSAGKG